MKTSSISKLQIPMTNDQINPKIPNPKQLLKQYEIRPSKGLGQNFLIDESVLKKIIESADLNSNDIILEIGSGLGVLTIKLAKKVKKVIAIEKDKRMCDILLEMLDVGSVKNVEIINQDILKIESNFLHDRDKSWTYKIVANLPYYITSPVMRKFLEAKNKPELMVLMVQKEVAQRILAKPPKMNLLAVAVQFYAEPQIISYVSKKSFFPQPKVDSAIIKIIPKPIPEIDTEKFFNLIRAGFSSKRKMLINNLSEKFKIKKEKLKTLLEELNINPKIRAENLSIDEWLRLYETIKSYF